MGVLARIRLGLLPWMVASILLAAVAGSTVPDSVATGSAGPRAEDSTGAPAPVAALSGSCSQTVSPGADVRGLARSAGNGSVICLNDGDFGTLTIDAQRSGYVTIRAVNPLKAVFDEINIDDASYVRLEQLKVIGSISNSPDNSNHIDIVGNDANQILVFAPSRNSSSGPGPTDWVIEHNDIQNCRGMCVGLLSENPDSYWPVSDIVVRGNKIGPMNGGSDAIRIHNWRNIAIEDNEIFGVIEDGQHNDCLQSVWGGQGLVFARNYLHDNNCQTFFLKGGYTQDIVFEENLSLRNRAGSAPVVGQIYPSRNVLIRNNTMWDDSGFYLRNGTYDARFIQGPPEDYVVTNNVMVSFVPYDNNEPNSNRAGVFMDPNILTEDYNVFGGGWTWVPSNMGTHSVENTNPSFINKSTNATNDFTIGDWRLASSVTAGGRTYTAGITWKLAGRLFGTAALGTSPPPTGGSTNKVTRLEGSNRFATSAAVASYAFGNPHIAYVVTGEDWPDALMAGSRGDGPVLLTGKYSVPSVVATALSQMDSLNEIVVVGGTSAVSNTVLSQLGQYAPKVTRIAGTTRYGTAVAFSERFHAQASVVYVATGENHADALATAAAAGHRNAPLLLTRGDDLPSVTRAELARLSPSEIIVVGGILAIDPSTFNKLKSYAGTVRRVAGGNRYATASAVSLDTFSSGGTVYMATGASAPDAVVATAAAIASGGPVLLVTRNSVPTSTATELQRLAPHAIILIGGTAAVARGVELDLAGFIR